MALNRQMWGSIPLAGIPVLLKSSHGVNLLNFCHLFICRVQQQRLVSEWKLKCSSRGEEGREGGRKGGRGRERGREVGREVYREGVIIIHLSTPQIMYHVHVYIQGTHRTCAMHVQTYSVYNKSKNDG